MSNANASATARRQQVMKRLFALVAFIALTAAAVFVFNSSKHLRPEDKAISTAEYVDSAQCAECHSEISESFQKTGMGRSFFRARSQTIKADFKTGNTF